MGKGKGAKPLPLRSVPVQAITGVVNYLEAVAEQEPEWLGTCGADCLQTVKSWLAEVRASNDRTESEAHHETD